jgi:hypothetical protein
MLSGASEGIAPRRDVITGIGSIVGVLPPPPAALPPPIDERDGILAEGKAEFRALIS